MSDPKVVFRCLIPGVDETMPIIQAREYRPKWVAAAREEFMKQVGGSYPTQSVKSMHRCPGISGLLTTGWIVRAWQDIFIETNGDGRSFGWGVNVDCQEFNRRPAVESANLGPLPHVEGSLHNVIKIHCPWMAEVPKGWNLLFVPMLYNDDTRFTTAPGILDTNIDSFINVQVYWHVLNGKEVIREGTPLVHLVPIPAEQSLEMEMKPWDNNTLSEQFKNHFKVNKVFLNNYSKFKDD